MTLGTTDSASALQTHKKDRRHSNPAQTWRPLRLFNLYRIVLAGFFCTIGFSTWGVKPIGETSPALFSAVSGIYLAITIINIFTIAAKSPRFALQVYIQVALDILVITVLMYASGGVKTGLGMLLIIAVASGSILLAGQAAITFAAFATLAMLGGQTLFQLHNMSEPTAYTHAGLLGASFFITALLSHALARRIRESEELAAKRGADLANMEQLAEYVIQRMQTGVVVIDNDERIWQINDSARHLLDHHSETPHHLNQVSPEIASQYTHWKYDPDYKTAKFTPSSGNSEILPRFAKLGRHGGTLIFLEDTTSMTHQAQQLKLASLGRLAGSIAHEIRNPLGAISHAEQLLAESSNLDKHDKRLTQIIHTNTRRMNDIIENVLQIGRRRQAIPETLMLKPWLENFLNEFCHNNNIEQSLVTLDITPDDLSIEFDGSQLHQILWNLCHNGARHSEAFSGLPSLALIAQTSESNPTPSLDIIDNGPGIVPADQEHIFEPFFTTQNKGTGLGLYIAKELCEYNHANLRYIPREETGSCFRISFGDPRRRRTQLDG